MYDIELKFEEVPVSTGGDNHPFALVSGNAAISLIPGGRWEFEYVELDNPIKATGPITFNVLSSPFWDWLTDSINREYGEKIYELAADARQPDPDRKHDARVA